ncbi:FtsB family cell division protein [Qingshengfaniella alkalisoli]|uniref:Septum formation initiator family protein n=1 Tax=Qingshengfaniella alkalisoli TaxID=2599296 RepID=A0A5B8IV33_9RHOB|nr:septum formation initiator family protein [Qingshengfaniella alkalisoli]QDY68721.1 septum formation initiator family protein [Qingshengfaniella alkalisoli]
MKKSGGFGFLVYFTLTLALAFYFSFAAIRGDLGVLERMSIDADLAQLEEERDQLADQVAYLRNQTQRLSDRYLDLDLLDERTRVVLGMMRSNEITLR